MGLIDNIGDVVSVNNGATDAGTQRVTLSNDSTGQVKLATGSAVYGTETNSAAILTDLNKLTYDNTTELQVSLYVKKTAAGDTVLTLGSATSANSVPVVIASDQAAISVNAGPTANITAIASAAYTTTQTQADQTNISGKGIKVFLNVTNIGTGSITLEIDGKDTASASYYAILTGAAVTTNGMVVYTVYPTIPAVANSIAQDVLPRLWRIKVVANNANSATYSVGATVVP